ncbi:MAG: hypothetical protein Q8K61_08820 [Gallionella sp.]|nr:hypothetical protein [Gallionella sp.]
MHADIISFQLAASRIGYSSAAAYVARRRSIFPIRVRQIGSKLVCFESDIQEYLRTGESQACLSVPAIKKVVAVKTGRPKMAESLEAGRKGLTVTQLRKSKAGVQ